MAGILDDSFSFVRFPEEETDPFDDLDVSPDTSEMQSLMTQLQQPECNCSVDEFISGDNELAFCSELDDEQWEEQFFNSLDPPTSPAYAKSESEEEQGLEPFAPKVKHLGEAISNLEDVHQFLDSKVQPFVLQSIWLLLSTALHCKAWTQSTLDDFIMSK